MSLILALAGGFLWFVLARYSLKPYSDPMNYLSDARRLPEVVATTRWPIGYLGFLYLLLPLLGPYYIFLSNLPLLICVAAMVARLTQRTAEDGLCPDDAPFAGVIATAFILAYDPLLLLQMVNPYRDPLSHLLLLASALALMQFLRRRDPRASLVFASGLLAGLSYAVRETAILATPFLGLAALCARSRHGTRVPLWKLGVLFTAAFALGCMPYLAQTFAHTQQLLVPAQAAVAGAIPGMHLQAFPATFSKAVGRFFWQATPLAFFFLLLAAFSALRRRSVPALALVLPLFLTYFVFYSFYWTYVPRYFFTAALFAAPLVGVGACIAARAVPRLVGAGRIETASVAVLAGASCIFAGWRMASTSLPGPRFLVAHGRRLAASVNQAIPAGSLLLAPRNFCEAASWFTHAESFPLSAFLGEPQRHPDEAIRAHAHERLAKGQALYILAHTGPRQRDLDYEAAARLFSLEESFSLSGADYPLSPAGPAGTMHVCRIAPWARTRSATRLDAFDEPDALLRVDVGPLRHGWPPRQYTRLLLNGRLLDTAPRDGANYYRIDRAVSPPPYTLILESDLPVPDSLAAAFLPSRGPLLLDFDVRADPSHAGHLASGFLPATPLREAPVLAGEGCLELPGLWPAANLLFAELEVRGTRLDRAAEIGLELSCEGLPPATRTIPKDRAFHAVDIALPPAPGAATIPLRLRAEDLAAPAGRPPAGLELDHVRVQPVFLAPERAIDVGAPDDGPFVPSGFYGRERVPSGETTYRWTAPVAEVRLFLQPTRSDLMLSLRFCAAFRPADAPAAMSMQLDGQPIEIASVSELDEGGWQTLKARIPAAMVYPTENALQLLCAGWAPPTADHRVLGVMVDRIELRAVAPEPSPAPAAESQPPAAPSPP